VSSVRVLMGEFLHRELRENATINARILFANKYSLLSTASYSCIRLSELRQRRINEFAQDWTSQPMVRTRVISVERTKLWPLLAT